MSICCSTTNDSAKDKKAKKNLESEVTGRKSTLNSTCSLNMIDYIREK